MYSVLKPRHLQTDFLNPIPYRFSENQKRYELEAKKCSNKKAISNLEMAF